VRLANHEHERNRHEKGDEENAQEDPQRLHRDRFSRFVTERAS